MRPHASHRSLSPGAEGGRRLVGPDGYPETFHKGTLWPEFTALSDELAKHVKEITDRVIREAIHADVTDPAEASEPRALPAARADEDAT